VVDNPNEPARVTPIDVTEYAAWRARGEPHLLLDVRTDEEWAIARIEGAQLLDERVEAMLEALPRDTPLVFQCHHGIRSQHAAQHFLGRGFRKVFNLTGGIDAWSARVDPAVPRY
jgi:monothiol glutaredoxin